MNMAKRMLLVPEEALSSPERKANLDAEVEPTLSVPRTKNLDVEVILSAIPKNYKNRARALMNHIAADPQQRIQWNERGELIYHGKVISGSHITDLLKNSQRQYRHLQPVGYQEFQDGLKELNVPIGLMEARPGPPGLRLAPQDMWLSV